MDPEQLQEKLDRRNATLATMRGLGATNADAAVKELRQEITSLQKELAAAERRRTLEIGRDALAAERVRLQKPNKTDQTNQDPRRPAPTGSRVTTTVKPAKNAPAQPDREPVPAPPAGGGGDKLKVPEACWVTDRPTGWPIESERAWAADAAAAAAKQAELRVVQGQLETERAGTLVSVRLAEAEDQERAAAGSGTGLAVLGGLGSGVGLASAAAAVRLDLPPLLPSSPTRRPFYLSRKSRKAGP
eukprot:SAG22_NODE_4754_length_1174_cov_1.271628_1_plen_244_part_10